METENKMIDFNDPKTQEVIKQLNEYYKTMQAQEEPGNIDQLFELFDLLDQYSNAVTEKDIEEIRKKAAEIANYIYKKPERVNIPTDNPTNYAFGSQAGQEKCFDMTAGAVINVAPKGKEAEVALQISFDQESEYSVIKCRTLTSYERAIYNSVCSLWESGQKQFTAKQVYELAAGKRDRNGDRSAGVKLVEKTIDKMRFMLLSIDYSKHLQLNNKGAALPDTVEQAAIDENFFYMRKCVLKERGREPQTGYEMLVAPALYRYSKAVKQVVTINADLLNLDINNSSDNIAIKQYLIKRIEQMKNPKSKASRNIKFDTLFFENQLNTNSRTLTNRYRNTVLKILDQLGQGDPAQGYKNYIKGYTVNKEGRKIVSVTIKI